jgi:hypothetical protein
MTMPSSLLRSQLLDDLVHHPGAELHIIHREPLIITMKEGGFLLRQLEGHEAIAGNTLLSEIVAVGESNHQRRGYSGSRIVVVRNLL